MPTQEESRKKHIELGMGAEDVMLARSAVQHCKLLYIVSKGVFTLDEIRDKIKSILHGKSLEYWTWWDEQDSKENDR